MVTKTEGRASHRDLIDDIVEAPSAASFHSNSASSFTMEGVKTLPARNYSSYSNIPTLFNNSNKSKSEQSEHSSRTTVLTDELRDRLNLTLPRSSSSTTVRNTDERRKELDIVLKHLYDGKLLTSLNDDRASSETSEHSIPVLTKGPLTATASIAFKADDETKLNVENLDLLSYDGDATSLQRELQEKELDIIHLHKEIQELQLENKLLKAKIPIQYQNGHTSNNTETEALRRERDILQNELRVQQELVAKLQNQQHNNGMVTRTSKLDEVTLHQKEALEKKLRAYEKQMRTLTNENDKLKQQIHQTDRTIAQLKRENEELQQKAVETKKRNDELLYQEFNALRNDLKSFKQRNDELFEENRRLLQEQQRQQQNLAWRTTVQQAFADPHAPQQQQQQPSLQNDIIVSSSPSKVSHSDSRRDRSKVRSDSPNLSEGSDSTNYLTSVSVERYHNRPTSAIHRSTKTEGISRHQSSKYHSTNHPDDFNRDNYPNSFAKSVDQQGNYRSSKSKRSVEWDEENIQRNEGPYNRDLGSYDHHHRLPKQRSPERSNDYAPPSTALSSPALHQQNYNLSRSTTLPDSDHQSRRSNSYHVSNRHMNNDDDAQHDDRHQHRHRRPSVETASPKRPYAPSSITDIHINDLVKFSRPGGKISKGIVKYIGPIPDKSDQYLGLELEDEESKHDGVYQGQRLFQCKPNKGVFVGFSKVIMAWSGK
ncbi:unnamed protein product [Adineta ricciae]|uniref:CAP-Gly domain-containing protein n=1 Tax=Adineta ricciae TaxID=249248 RepID=A0A815KRL3_ADIRI|nr:unnamed protein product [Adineta ricciae]